MNCREARDRLTAARNVPQELERHLETCAACRRYSERLRTARRLLRDHHGNVEPDGAFAARVAARLPRGPAEVLGWAAVKLLPATVAVALVLAWLAFQQVPATPVVDEPTTVAEAIAPTDDLLSWVIEQTGDEP